MHQRKKHKYARFSVIMLLLALFMTTSIGKLTETAVKAEGETEDLAPTPLPTLEESSLPALELEETQEPEETQKPEKTQEPEETQKPQETPKPTATVKPTPKPTSKPTPTPKPFNKVSGVKLVRYSTNAVKVTWKKVSKANYYKVYYSQTKNGKYKLSGVTKNQQLLVKKLKNKKKYYIYVQACEKKNKESAKDSAPSKKVSMMMKTYQRKIIFAGDSICQGVGYGQSFPAMKSSAKKKTVAYKGLNTITFRTKIIFNGMTGMQRVIAEKPYRLYMMLGINEVHYRPASQIIADYKELMKSIQKGTPNTDIVLCAVSPVTRAEQARNPGMKNIPALNSKIKALAKTLGVKYLDYTSFLKDSAGFLQAGYSAGDGYHWQPSAYTKFGKVVGSYDKSLDE